jgi:integrase
VKNSGLTSKKVEYLKPGPERIEIPAGPPGGLTLIVHPSGKKVFALRYRIGGKTRKGTLGNYPDMKLSDARVRAVADLKQIDAGIDPYAPGVKVPENPNTVRFCAEEWYQRHIDVNVDWPEAKRILNHNVVAAWDGRLITDIGRADVLRLLDAIVDRGAPVGANRTLAVLRAWLNWCVDRGILQTSPAAGVRPPTVEMSRDRVLSPAELSDVWNIADTLGYPLGPYTKVLILTAQRRTEVAAMRWRDVDLDRGMWTLPAEQTKPGRVHDVPLSGAVLEILTDAPRFTQSDYIWTTTGGSKPINGFSKMKSRIDKEMLKRRTEIPEWTLHDLRRTAATSMAKAGVPPHVLAAILNHTPGSTQGVTHIYNRFRYTEERRQALADWAQYIFSLTKSSSRVATA